MQKQIEVEDVDNGNILAPLMRLRDKYEARSEKLARSAHGEGAEGKLETSKAYIEAAASIDRLITLGNCRTI